MSEIENTSCVRSFMNMTLVYRIERETWVAASILRRFSDGVCICKCSVRYDEYNRKTKHAFLCDSHFKTLHQSKFCGDIIDNRSDVPIFFGG